MKRISFKDSGGLNLTQAVLSGRKTMTRRAVPEWVERNAMVYAISQGEDTRVKDYFRLKFAHILGHSPYKVSGHGTWNRNPLVWAYSFERID